jgi:hypothetical protein
MASRHRSATTAIDLNFTIDTPFAKTPVDFETNLTAAGYGRATGKA